MGHGDRSSERGTQGRRLTAAVCNLRIHIPTQLGGHWQFPIAQLLLDEGKRLGSQSSTSKASNKPIDQRTLASWHNPESFSNEGKRMGKMNDDECEGSETENTLFNFSGSPLLTAAATSFNLSNDVGRGHLVDREIGGLVAEGGSRSRCPVGEVAGQHFTFIRSWLRAWLIVPRRIEEMRL
jgi:hypothetical protein